MLLFIIALSFILSIPFGILSRMNGGGFYDLPFGLDAHLYALPYAILGCIYGGFFGFVLGYTFAFIGKRTGHGQYMDLGTWNKEVEPEKVDFLVQLAYGKDTYNNKWRDLFGLTLTGLLVAIGAGFVLIFTGHVFMGLGVLLGGSLKGIAYLIGWNCDDLLHNATEDLREPTAMGEFLTGVFGGFPVILSIILGII